MSTRSEMIAMSKLQAEYFSIKPFNWFVARFAPVSVLEERNRNNYFAQSKANQGCFARYIANRKKKMQRVKR